MLKKLQICYLVLCTLLARSLTRSLTHKTAWSPTRSQNRVQLRPPDHRHTPCQLNPATVATAVHTTSPCLLLCRQVAVWWSLSNDYCLRSSFTSQGARDLGVYKITKNNVYFQAQAWQVEEIDSEVSISRIIDAGGGGRWDSAGWSEKMMMNEKRKRKTKKKKTAVSVTVTDSLDTTRQSSILLTAWSPTRLQKRV